MDINKVVENTVVGRMERLLIQQYATQHFIDVNKAMTQAIEETTHALIELLNKRN